MKLYNSLTQQKEAVDKHLKIYVCGLTVYDRMHIGHLRTMLAFDLLIRFLRTQQYEINYVRNITDVDDKIINRMQAENTDWKTLTENVITEIKKEEKILGLIEPDAEPKASDYIAEMIEMITILLEKGYAYVAKNNDVYFSVSAYKEYGKLSKQRLSELLKANRVDDVAKKASADFILWKQAKENEPAWPSPWGEGRPGWHIECSAISRKLLGTIDIHGGGVDLKFPHHENEIAQSECASDEVFVKSWVHVGALLVNNEKMSKSLNNFITVSQFLKQYHPELIRLFLLKSHYRQPYNYTEEGVSEMQTVLVNFYLSLFGKHLTEFDENNDYWQRFCQSLYDDLNVSKALLVMHEVSIQIANDESLAIVLVKMGEIFGILQSSPIDFLQNVAHKDEIETMVAERSELRENKDFQAADEIRDKLLALDIMIEDRESSLWYYRKAGFLHTNK